MSDMQNTQVDVSSVTDEQILHIAGIGLTTGIGSALLNMGAPKDLIDQAALYKANEMLDDPALRAELIEHIRGGAGTTKTIPAAPGGDS